MKSLSLILLAGLLLAASNSFATAQLATANIPFSFIVEGKTYPSGSYRISLNDAESTVTLQNEKANMPAVLALILTRLSRRPENTAEVIFDVVGKDHYLSEIYVPNMDGFYFKSATGKHTHEIVKAPKN